VEQQERKSYTEFDTLHTLQDWQQSIRTMFSTLLDSGKSLDLWKYGLRLRDPKQRLSPNPTLNCDVARKCAAVVCIQITNTNCMGGSRGKPEMDFWQAGLDGCSPTRLLAKIGVLAKMKKTDLDKTVLKAAHPVLTTYSAFTLRVRFLKGFSSKAIEVLRVEVFERMAKAIAFKCMR
jgi:hypothetical protein